MARVRREVWGLGAGWNDTLLWYARAVRILQSRTLTDPTSWWFLAAIHGIHPLVWETFDVIQATTPAPPAPVQLRFWSQCQHQTWYFLPWHRGYLAAFEQIVRAAVVSAGGPDDWALPYWNYSLASSSSALTMPTAFEMAKLPDGTDNPLRVERRFGSGTSPIQIDPDFVSLAALQHDAFQGGDSDVPPGFGGPETVFHHGPESDTTNGGLESLPHNVLHGAIGGFRPGGDPEAWQDQGLMSMPITAALDPIFWLHHSNIDRLWNVWLRDTEEVHKNPEEDAWLDGPAGRQFVMPQSDGSEWIFTASDVLDTTAPALDYRYDDETAPDFERRAPHRLTRLGARLAAGDARRGEEAGVGSGKTPELIGASDGPVRVKGSTGAAVRLDPASTRLLRRDLSRAVAADVTPSTEPARVFIKLEGIRGTSDAAIYKVYVGVSPDENPADYRDRLAGTVSLFGVSAASDANGPTAGSGINQVLEVTEIVDALHLSGADLDRLDVRFVPANPAAAGANVSIGRLSVFKLE